MSPQNESSKQGDQQAIRPSDTVYSIVTRNKTPRINPAEKVEIEIFLSGYGIPKKNKLYIQWSSPYIIDQIDPGFATHCIRFVEVAGKRGPEAGKKILQTHPLTPNGLIVNLNEGYFSEIPLKPGGKKPSQFEVPRVMSEYLWDDEPPILLSINTAKKARPGDYDVMFTLTYGNEQNLLQDYKAVQFHITSWWERKQGLAIIIAFISLLVTAFGTVYRIFHP